MGAFIINMINALIRGLGAVLTWVIALLPTSPFQLIANTGVGEYLANLAWIIPFTEIIAILECWTAAIVTYYCIQAILRWVKMVE